MVMKRDKPYTAGDFVITKTPTGMHTVRWKHNNRACETFRYPDAEKRAKNFVKWLVKYLNTM